MYGVTVKVALAELGVLELSLATTVLAPATEEVEEPAGTLNDAAKEPELSVVTGDGDVTIAVPANVKVIVLRAPKP